MKKLLLIAAAAASPLLAMAGGLQWTLQNRVYNVDTLYHAKIGPGTTQTSLDLTGAQKLRVFYTTTDLTDPYVDIRVTKASKKYTGCQTLSAQQKANDRAGARYFAGVNADFFGNSAPIGSTVVDGEVINIGTAGWVNWYMTDDKKPHIATLNFNGTAIFPSGATHAVTGINSSRNENNLVIYNKFYNGSNTGTNMYGYEAAITPIEGSLTFNGVSRYRVTSAPSSAGKMAIPADGYVISGHGTAAALVQQLKVGDELTLNLNPSLGDKVITQMASGMPVILQNGETLNTQGALDHLTSLNPRTAVGFNADGTRLVFLVVDGRQGVSVGVVSKVLADIMREVGCTEAMNFDGGGSSELYTSAFGVRNHPSDGSERAVTDAAWCVAVAPDDNTVAEIAFTGGHITLPKYGFYIPQIYAYNKYGVLINTDLKGVTLSCDEALGTIVDDGTTLFANGGGTHALTATYNGVTCTVPVTIGNGQPQMRLSGVLVDPYHDYTAEVTAAVGDLAMPVDNKALVWTSADPDIATVDDLGVIHGIKNGTTVITGTVEEFKGTLPVTVEVPEKRWLTVDPDRSDLSKWTVSKTSMSEASVTRVDDEAFDVSYNVSSTRGPKLTVKISADCYAIPDSLRLVFTPGDAQITSVTLNAGAKDQRAVAVSVTPDKDANGVCVIDVPVSDFIDTKDFANYPFNVTSIAFSVGDATKTPRTFRVNALQSVYAAIPYGTEGVHTITTDTPAAGDIRYYDLRGNLMRGSLAPGLYIRRQGTHADKVLVK